MTSPSTPTDPRRPIHRFGDLAWLVEVSGTTEAIGLAASIRAASDDLVDVVPGDCTVLVRCHRPDALAAVRETIEALPPRPTPSSFGAVVELPTIYDGADLREVSHLTGLTVAEIVEAHTSSRYTVGFLGFAPGFAYLIGGDPRLVTPRRDRPRAAVPAGAVALADDFCGVYPRRSPGGWQLIGRTPTVLWDSTQDPPSPFSPGTPVRFVAV